LITGCISTWIYIHNSVAWFNSCLKIHPLCLATYQSIYISIYPVRRWWWILSSAEDDWIDTRWKIRRSVSNTTLKTRHVTHHLTSLCTYCISAWVNDAGIIRRWSYSLDMHMYTYAWAPRIWRWGVNSLEGRWGGQYNENTTIWKYGGCMIPPPPTSYGGAAPACMHTSIYLFIFSFLLHFLSLSLSL